MLIMVTFIIIFSILPTAKGSENHPGTTKEMKNEQRLSDYSDFTQRVNATPADSFNLTYTTRKIVTTDKDLTTKSYGELNSSCRFTSDCSWEKAECLVKGFESGKKFCQCSYPYSTPNPKTKRCLRDIPTTGNGELGSSCQNAYDCKWNSAICSDLKCVCPSYYPVIGLGDCRQVSRYEGDFCRAYGDCASHLWCINYVCKPLPTLNFEKIQVFALAFAICVNIIFICLTAYSCLCKRCRSAGENSSRSSTNSYASNTLGLRNNPLRFMTELTDIPPQYSEVITIGPNSRTSMEKPPTYEEAMQETTWQSVELFAAAHDNPAYEAELASDVTTHTNENQPIVLNAPSVSELETPQTVTSAIEETSNTILHARSPVRLRLTSNTEEFHI